MGKDNIIKALAITITYWRDNCLRYFRSGPPTNLGSFYLPKHFYNTYCIHNKQGGPDD